MIYRGPGFLAFVWIGGLAPSLPPPPSPVIKLYRRHTRRLRKRDNLLTYRTLLTYYYMYLHRAWLTTYCSTCKELVLPTTILENKLYVLQYFLITWFNYYYILYRTLYLPYCSKCIRMKISCCKTYSEMSLPN
jgi:hypothetical protein